MTDQIAGRYRHFKGSEYEIIGVAKSADNGICWMPGDYVIYRRVGSEDLYFRSVAEFAGIAELTARGEVVHRFTHMEGDQTVLDRIIALEQQLAASEAGAGVMRKALIRGHRCLHYHLDGVVETDRAIVAALATPTGKAAAERLARYEAALRRIANGLYGGKYEPACEIARQALEEK